MRYQNWDILLFPGQSRIPIQEYDTKCHAVPNSSTRLMRNNSAYDMESYTDGFESMAQLPMLTTFIASLEHGTPFRISIHSWETPKISQLLKSVRTQEESVAYEARVYVDGTLMVQKSFLEQATWPEVIETVGSQDYERSSLLRFPAFHSEILDQAHWNPAEVNGRIRVVLAEGVMRHSTLNTSRGGVFDRLRDVVAFSFQHAPQHILEYSGIAWPHLGLFRRSRRMPTGSEGYNVISSSIVPPVDFEAHAHSPQRLSDRNVEQNIMPELYLNSIGQKQIYPDRAKAIAPLHGYAGGAQTMVQKLGASSGPEDPFTEPAPILLRGRQPHQYAHANDISLLDYATIKTRRSHPGTEMSDVSYQRPDFEKTMSEAAIEEIVAALSPVRQSQLVEALSPSKKSVNGVQAPTNSPLDSEHANSRRHDQASKFESLFSEYVEPSRVKKTSGRGLLDSKYATASKALYEKLDPLGSKHGRHQSLRNGLYGEDGSPQAQPKLSQSNVSDWKIPATTGSIDSKHRSSSNNSKRKRTDSPPMLVTTSESVSTPNTSATPEQRSAGHVKSSNVSPHEGGGGVLLK